METFLLAPLSWVAERGRAVLSRFDSIPKGAALVVGTLTALVAIQVVYRLYLHPLAHIPGPKIAAATGWYEFYHQTIRKGKYAFLIRKWHEEYGYIVRINPWEVHIADPDFFDKMYNQTSRLHKESWYYGWVGRKQSHFRTVDPDQHRLRRAPLARFFSTASIAKIEPILKEKTLKLIRGLERYRINKQPVCFGDAFRAYSADVVNEYALPDCPDYLDAPDFSSELRLRGFAFSVSGLWMRDLPFVEALIERTPLRIMRLVASKGMQVLRQQVDYRIGQIEKIRATNGAPVTDKKTPVIMEELYKSDLPPEEKAPRRIYHETGTIIGAGTETTAHTLTVTLFSLLDNPEWVEKLYKEVSEVERDDDGIMSYKQLEHLPILSACIEEGLRLANAVTGRMPRYNPNRPITYKNYTLPPGTPISMSIWYSHHNSTIFPDPEAYKPQRWLEGDGGRSKTELEKYFIPFSRGTRNCLGKNLAMVELQMGLANVVARFPKMSLHETTKDDLKIEHDFFGPSAGLDSKGLRVMLE